VDSNRTPHVAVAAMNQEAMNQEPDNTRPADEPLPWPALLLVGIFLEGADFVRPPQTRYPSGRGRRLALGIASSTASWARHHYLHYLGRRHNARAGAVAGHGSAGAGEDHATRVRPVADLKKLPYAWRRALVRWAEEGRAQELLARSSAHQFVNRAIDATAAVVLQRPPVRQAVARLSAELTAEPQVWTLINAILRYLSERPELRALVHEQSTTMADEALYELRTQARRADGSVDRFVSRLFRRTRPD
jgi:hypothetical protein